MMAGPARPNRQRSLASLAELADDPCDVAMEAMPGAVIGDLDDPDRQWLAEHVEECQECRQELRAFAAVTAMLDAFEVHVPGAGDLPPLQLAGIPARWTMVPSPIGELFVAVAPAGLCEIGFERWPVASHLDDLRRRGYDPTPGDGDVAAVAQQLGEYFAGTRQRFDVDVDLSSVPTFSRQVLRKAQQIPFGSVTTYADLAAAVGKPGASRAVGNALARNPVPIVVPCHRIVRSDRAIGGYAGGPDLKRRLLALEGALLSLG